VSPDATVASASVAVVATARPAAGFDGNWPYLGGCECRCCSSFARLGRDDFLIELLWSVQVCHIEAARGLHKLN